MKLLKTVNVLSTVYKVFYFTDQKKIDADDDKISGTTDHDTKVIKIWSGQDIQEVTKTLIHEIVEAMNYEFYIRLAHGQIEKLENAIWDTFRRNGLWDIFKP